MLENELKIYKDTHKELNKLNYIYYVLSFDEETDCPQDNKEFALNILDEIYGKMINVLTSETYSNALKTLYDNREKLEETDKLCVEEDYKDIIRINKVPREELDKHISNLSRSGLLWKKSRETLDYTDFEKELKELVDYNFKYIKWQDKGFKEPYDTLLDEMEDDFTTEKYDEFFNLIKERIVPLAKKICKMPKLYNTKICDLKFNKYDQMKLTNIICTMMGYTNKNGAVRETIHPFTSGFSTNDVRITTEYNESLLLSNLYSVMHETGHALYELGIDPKYNGTSLFGGTSCAVHESQSRFMENYLGRSYAFTKKLYSIVKELFPEQFSDITLDDLYYYANDVSNQFTRTEADELTYPIHILIRYEVEKALFKKEITVDQISDKFNDLFEEYLGARPSNKLEGCYQDVHWSSGFGYFPTYALGNAFAAEFMHKMKETLDLDKLMEEGNFAPINKWLDENIHQYGKSVKNLKLIENACGEPFNPHYYIDYLEKKFKTIYKVD